MELLTNSTDSEKNSSLNNALKNMNLEEILEEQLSRLDKLTIDCCIHEVDQFDGPMLTKKCSCQSDRTCDCKDSGCIGWMVDKLPYELHLPGYRFCGPGTKLVKRIARGDEGINILDEECKAHDIAYAESKSKEDRRKADEVLIAAAWQIATDKEIKQPAKVKAWAYFIVICLKIKIITENLYSKFASQARKTADDCMSLLHKILREIVGFYKRWERMERNRIIFLAGTCSG